MSKNVQKTFVEPSLSLEVCQNGTEMKVNFENLDGKEIELNYFLIDLEVFFSNSPFFLRNKDPK